ncbi:Alcohol dehydrogenase 1 [Hirsutella minnesotensis 3608]|uniref:alcohol dehydrogenase n=1 Tax=Hirsutella minnesotensis 3608 TaxID=1043627 RepID=A0A0F8A1U0_9HYPO|nr:Alcohol dehydrogenase 1 [Hirsutella minnesotensis 3608]
MDASQIPREQWAQVVEQTGGPVTYKKIAVQQPGPDEVLVNVKYSGVCHTDLHAMLGDWPIPTKLPLVGGHEGAGVVVARGEVVKDINLGDHVGIKWLNGSCLNCVFCNQADEPLCREALLSGYTVDGTFQQYAIAKAAHVARIPKECDLAAIAPILCAGITVYKGLKESAARPAIMGLYAVAIDGGDEKRRACLELGANTFIDYTTSNDITADVRAASLDGLGPHAILVIAAQEKPFQQAAKCIRPRGTIVCIGLPHEAMMSAPVFDTVVNMVTIKGSYVGNRADTAEALDFFRRGLIHAPYKTIGLSKLQDVYEMMQANRVTGRFVVDTGS